MEVLRLLAVITALACAASSTAFGQRVGGGMPHSYGSEQLAKIFGKIDAFTANAETSVIDKQGHDPIQMSMSYAFLKGNMRTEMDMASMKGTKMPPEAVAHMKQMGLDRNVTIYRGDKKLLYMLYPGLKAYCEINPQQFQQPEKSEQKAPKTEVTKLGQETLDGHPCTKSKITITGDDGVQHEILAWQANDLHEFPIKTEMQAEGATVTMHFRDVKLSAPDASLFEPPGDYKHYGSMQEMMMNSMQHMMPQGMPPMPRGHEEQ